MVLSQMNGDGRILRGTQPVCTVRMCSYPSLSSPFPLIRRRFVSETEVISTVGGSHAGFLCFGQHPRAKIISAAYDMLSVFRGRKCELLQDLIFVLNNESYSGLR